MGPLSGTVGACGRSCLDEGIVTFAKLVCFEGSQIKLVSGQSRSYKKMQLQMNGNRRALPAVLRGGGQAPFC